MRKGVKLPTGRDGFKRPLLLPEGPLKIDRIELAWAAGFFDGEGCTTMQRPRLHPRLSITQAPDPGEDGFPRVLIRFRTAVGEMGSINGPYTERTGERKYIYAASGHEMVQAIISAMWIWLGTVKRGQAKGVLHRYREVDRGRRAPGARFGRPIQALCKRGHDYSDITLNKAGNRVCRPCVNLHARERMRRIRAEWSPLQNGLVVPWPQRSVEPPPRPAGPCRSGHDRADAILNSAGQWECRTCKNLRQRERARRHGRTSVARPT